MVKVQIPADEEGAQKLLHLHGDVERDGNDEVVQDQKRQEVRDKLQDLRDESADTDQAVTPEE